MNVTKTRLCACTCWNDMRRCCTNVLHRVLPSHTCLTLDITDFCTHTNGSSDFLPAGVGHSPGSFPHLPLTESHHERQDKQQESQKTRWILRDSAGQVASQIRKSHEQLPCLRKHGILIRCLGFTGRPSRCLRRRRQCAAADR